MKGGFDVVCKKFEFNKITLRDLWGLVAFKTTMNLRSVLSDDGRQFNYGQFTRGYNDPFDYFDFEICKIEVISPFSITVQILVVEFNIYTGKVVKGNGHHAQSNECKK